MLVLYGVRLWDGLRAGIAMRNGKFLLMHWFKTVRLLASTKSMSLANGMQRQPPQVLSADMGDSVQVA